MQKCKVKNKKKREGNHTLLRRFCRQLLDGNGSKYEIRNLAVTDAIRQICHRLHYLPREGLAQIILGRQALISAAACLDVGI